MLDPIVRGCTRAALSAYDWLLARLGRRQPYAVLEIDLSGDLVELAAEGRIPVPWRRSGADLISVLGLLRWAREDRSLRAVLVRCGAIGAGWARVQEVRSSLEKLRRVGVEVWFQLDHAGVHEYYLASVADRVVLTPAGTLDVAGLATEAVFLLDLLETVGVRADVVQMGKYKSAGEMFTRREMSLASREMTESMIDDLFGQIVDDVAASRGMDADAVRALLGKGPYVAASAREKNLIDDVAFTDETRAALIEKMKGARVVEQAEYVSRRGREVRRRALRDKAQRLALVHLQGAIRVGEGGGLDGGRGVSAKALHKCLEELREREDIAAVIARVSSPGGSGLASSLLWRDLVRLGESKPLLFSFGDVAASGGYYVALAGKKIFAAPGSLTGSIGVIAGKATLRELYDKLGVRKDIVGRGEHAALHSDYVPLGESERKCIEDEAATFYEDFVGKVADARALTRDQAEECAQGRVWTGRQAHERGLVDEIGGFDAVLDAAKVEIGVDALAPVVIERYPKPRSIWKTALGRGVGARASWSWEIASLLPDLRALARERVWAILPFRIDFH